MARKSKHNTFPKDAVKRPGALMRKADKAGQSPMEFARAHYHSPGRTGQQARFAVNRQKRTHKRSGRK